MRLCPISALGRFRFFVGWFIVIFLVGFYGHAAAAPISVFVSILPEKYFVERVGGSHVDVSVMVGPGQEPETYEPTPKQMTALSGARVYFRIEVPFETVWMAKIRAANPGMLVVDLAEDIKKRPIDRIGDGGTSAAAGFPDPHVWLSPPLARRMAARIRDVLTELDPAHRNEFARNDAAFAADLDALDRDPRPRLRICNRKRSLPSIPPGATSPIPRSKQIAIESEGKEPGPRTLLQLIDQAKRLKIKVVFVEPQFSKSSAEMVAREIGGRVVAIDPLAQDYIRNMRHVADVFSEALGAE